MPTSEEKASFTIELEDNASDSVDSAADALRNLQKEINADKRELQQLQAAMKNLQLGTVVNVQQFRELSNAISSKRSAIATAQAQFIDLGGSFKKAAPVASGFKAKIEALEAKLADAAAATKRDADATKALAARNADLVSTAGQLPGIFGKIASGLTALATGTALTIAGIVALAAAFGLLVLSIAKATIATAKYTIEQANARRAELLRLDGISRIRTAYSMAYGLARNKAEDLQSAIDEVSASVSISRDKVVQYATQLDRMGVRGANFKKALQGIGTVASAAGDEQAGMFAQWYAAYSLTGQSVDKLSEKIKNRWGGIVVKQMRDVTVVAQKQEEALSRLFSRVDIEAYTKANQELGSMFAETTAAGKAFKALLPGILQPLIDGATLWARIQKRFWQGMILGALEVGIALLKLRNLFRKVFGPDTFKGLTDNLDVFVYAGIGAFGTILLLVLAIGAVLATLAVAFLIALAPVIGAFVVLGLLVYGLVTAFNAAYDFIANMDWGGLWDGILQSLTKFGDAAYEAVTTVFSDLAAGAAKAFKEALGIASPSKVFAQFGKDITAGVTIGVKAGAVDAQAAVDGMISVPRDGTDPASQVAQPDAAKSGGAAGGGSVTIGELHVHSTATDAKGLAVSIKQELESILEGVALQMGAPA